MADGHAACDLIEAVVYDAAGLRGDQPARSPSPGQEHRGGDAAATRSGEVTVTAGTVLVRPNGSVLRLPRPRRRTGSALKEGERS
jgi:hypothetical protein